MKSYTLSHNGTGIIFSSSLVEIQNYIEKVLSDNADLKPKEIYRGDGTINFAMTPKKNISGVLIFQYYTLYSEVFMIESEEINEEALN